MAQKKAASITMVIRGRLSFVNVFVPQKFDEGQQAKYSVTVMVPEGDPQVKTIAQAIKKIANEEWGPGSDKKLGQQNGIRNVFRNGSERVDEYPEFAGCMFFSANSSRKPGMVDKDLQPIISPEDIYSGVDAQVQVNFYAYDVKGKGVAAGLNHIRVIRKLEAFSGGGDASKQEWPEVEESEEGATDDMMS